MNTYSSKKTAIALSGGIDSAVAAAMLREEGHDLFALHMLIPMAHMAKNTQAAEAVAHRLHIPFYTVDVRELFTKEVIDYFTSEYQNGRTPNPCVVCNKQVKLGHLLGKARSLGAEKIATGHYARIEYHEDTGRFALYKGRDATKDQSYFLSTLGQEQLARLLLPLSELSKDEVRDYARRLGLKDLTEGESQEICFIPQGDYKEFLQNRIKPDAAHEGEIIDTEGVVRGRHPGLYHFTVGQRRGLGLPDVTPFYVIGFNVARKQVIIGKKEDLYRRTCAVKNINWISVPEISEPLEVLTRIRYKHREALSILTPANKASVQVRFYEPQRAVTPGQVAVFYRNNLVVGGGFIV